MMAFLLSHWKLCAIVDPRLERNMVNPAANVPLNLNVPFNLNLLPAEREARNQVQNPNDNVPARNAGGGGQILYAPDEADDVDDEDPDEDLDF
nr:hypothetical protein BaRGS_007479 [Batillaria attramentaria]